MSQGGKIFAWRHAYSSILNQEDDEIIGRITGWKLPAACPFCAAPCLKQTWPQKDELQCLVCGWSLEVAYPDLSYARDVWMLALRAFDINSCDLAIHELGAHLKDNISDVYALSWRRFEILIEDVFRRLGFRTVLTQATRDDGADILVLKNEANKVDAIVECKRYSKTRTVGVQVVRSLVGAALAWDVRHAYLITSSAFSGPAQSLAEHYRDVGYQVDLVAMTDVAKILGVYNTALPPLEKLTPEMREEIRRTNGGG